MPNEIRGYEIIAGWFTDATVHPVGPSTLEDGVPLESRLEYRLTNDGHDSCETRFASKPS